jgi:hypothetical protein
MNITKFWYEIMKVIYILKELGAEGEIILNCLFSTRVVWCGLDISDSGQGLIITVGKKVDLLYLFVCDDFSNYN